jgi:hypothetical protein
LHLPDWAAIASLDRREEQVDALGAALEEWLAHRRQPHHRRHLDVIEPDQREVVRDAQAERARSFEHPEGLDIGRGEDGGRGLRRRNSLVGVPVTVITPPEEPSSLKSFTDGFSAEEPPPSAG